MAGGLQELLQKQLGRADRPISAEKAAAGTQNPLYNIVTTKQAARDPNQYPDRILRIQEGINRGLSMDEATAQANSSAAWAGGKKMVGEFETNMAELDREWLADAIASGMPEEGDLSPAPAPRKSQPGPGDFTMAFDMNDYSPWLRKRRGSLMG